MLAIVMLALIVIAANLGVASSSTDYTLLCLRNGEKVEYSKCNPRISDKVCDTSTNGLCKKCVYRGSKGYWCPARINHCNDLGAKCTYLSGGDVTPPTVTMNSPEDNIIYNKTSIIVKGSSNEKSNWFYSLNGGNDKKLCYNRDTCEKKVTFKNGQNNLTVKIKDAAKNTVLKNIVFYIDSKKPKIIKTAPKSNRFASGVFLVYYTEENIKEVTLNYGLKDALQQATLLDCPSGTKEECAIDVDLSSYSGQTIYYSFTIKDIAGNIANSKLVKVKA